jgi:hypothetical protein
MTMIRRGFGRPAGEKPQTTPLATTAGPVVQVRLYTTHTIINGSLRLAFNRLSDHLNFGPPVLELGMAELVRLDHPQVHRAQQVAYIQREAVIMALDRLSDDYVATHPALHREKESLDVTADLGHFIVKGTLHLRHGMDLANWLIDAPLFVPLTAVTIYGDGGQPVHDSLAIINRATLSAILH